MADIVPPSASEDSENPWSPRYLELDPALIESIEMVRLSDGAFRLHISALLYCAEHRITTWVVPVVALAHISRRYRARHLNELVQQGLWESVGIDHYQIQPLFLPGGTGWRMKGRGTSRPPISSELRQAVYDRDGRACRHCGATTNLSLDHIHPFSLGGDDTYENLQTLCRSCNSKKGARV